MFLTLSYTYKLNRKKDCYRDKKTLYAFLDVMFTLDTNDQEQCASFSLSLTWQFPQHWPRIPLHFPNQFPLSFEETPLAYAYLPSLTICIQPLLSCIYPVLSYAFSPLLPCSLASLLPWPCARHLLCDTSIMNVI